MTQPDDKRETSPAGDSSENDSSRTRTRTRTRRRDESSSSETAKSGASKGSDAPSTSGRGDANSKDDASGGRSSSRSRRSRSGSGRSDADAETKTDTSGSSAKGDEEAPPKKGSSNRKTSSGGGRSRSKDASNEDAKGSAEGGASEGSSGGSGSKGAKDDDDSSSNRRRRGRRGRRGRGRGRSGEDGGSENKGSENKGSGDKSSGEDSSSDTRSGKSSRSSSAKKGEKGGKGDDAVKDAIEKGGTRMAAKRGSSRGGGSRSGSRGGGGGGSRGGGRHQRPTGVSEEVRRAILDGPPRTMLVTSTEERTQIAVLEDRTVVEHHVTRKQDVTYVGNIYMARVQNVLPGMEAAFLDIGKGRNGVLYAGEVLYDELDVEESVENPRIEDALKQGQKVLVQVTKDPMGSKGPRLTMHLSLAGRYMVLAPNSDLFGISRKLTDKERDRLRRIVKKVKPDHHGVIVRTAAENATEEQLTADLERLLKKWEKAEKKAGNAKALTPVYEEPSLVVKVIRDNFGPEFERCVVDSPELYVQVCDYLEEVAPELLAKVELYGQKKKPEPEPAAEVTPEPTAEAEEPTGDDATAASGEADPSSDEGEQAEPPTEGETPSEETKADAPKTEDAKAESSDSDDDAGERELPEVDTKDLAPLFDSYHVNEQLRKAMGRKVWLPSGGYLIIESTEAMKVIDVNTGKFTGDAKSNLEEVVLKTNLEAAEEIVRQLRLRDLGGIIVIDFIDMLLKTNQDQVVRKLKRELLRDRTKTRVSEVSRLGLVQMTRKNVSQGLVEAFSHKCESCEGHGYINELDD